MTGPVLLLGGTGEARELAEVLVRDGLRVVSSLAGRTVAPRLPVGQVRVGGFGGAAGMASWMTANGVAVVVDATHPFAAAVTASAADAAAAAGVPLLRLHRPGWTAGPHDDWRWVDSPAQAASVASAFESVFLTIGRQHLAAFADLPGSCLLRSVDPPQPPLPPRATVLLDRGPFTVQDETALMRRYAVDLLVTKDSGGAMTAAKLAAARGLAVPVVLVRRPPVPAGVAVVPDVAAARAWVRARAGMSPAG